MYPFDYNKGREKEYNITVNKNTIIVSSIFTIKLDSEGWWNLDNIEKGINIDGFRNLQDALDHAFYLSNAYNF